MIFDDVLAARGETFRIVGLSVVVHGHADSAVDICVRSARDAPDVVFMDYSMGAQHKSGADAIRELRAAGYGGRIVAISSDPAANAAMEAAGADEALDKKAHLRSFMVQLGTRADSA